jgi:RNA polymerase sigma-70 factor (ECF subfamily)
MDENPKQPEHEVATSLVERVRNGDPRAEAEMVGRYSRGLRFLLRRKMHDPQLAEDFLQETWIVALAKIRSEGLDDPGRLAGYLCGIANNLVRSETRRVGRQRTTVDSEIIDLIPDESDNPFRQFKRAEVAGHVRSLLAELSQERDRDILHSFYVREEDKESICTRLGVDSTHFNRVLHRARNRLKDVAQRQALRGQMHVVN